VKLVLILRFAAGALGVVTLGCRIVDAFEPASGTLDSRSRTTYVNEVTDRGLDQPNIISDRSAVVVPLPPGNSSKEIGRTLHIVLLPLAVSPDERLVVQAKLLSEAEPGGRMDVKRIGSDASASAFFKPPHVGVKEDIFLPLDAWTETRPPVAVAVGVVSATGQPIKSIFELLEIELLS
jgi:hypothetical protein